MSSAPLPTDIKLHKKSRTLELSYPTGNYELTAEYLRVYSPSAEVRGHGIGNEVLQTGKKFVGIDKLEASGNYALKIFFNDGHDSGLYTWDHLYKLATQKETLWQEYLQKLEAAGETRDAGLIGKA